MSEHEHEDQITGYSTGGEGPEHAEAAEGGEESGYSTEGMHASEMGSSNVAEQAESEYGVGTSGESDDLPAADE